MNALAARALALFLCSLSLPLGAEKLAEFQESFKHIIMTVDEDNIYVADKQKCVVRIYSKRDFHQTGQFGRMGQGPEDFEFIGFFQVFADYIFVSSGRKVSYFSKQGDFLRTVTPPYPATGSYTPLGSNFVGKRYLPEDPRETWHEVIVELFNENFIKIKDLYLAKLNKIESYDFKSGKKNLLVASDCFKFEVYEDRLFVGNTVMGFFFRVFDAQGERLYDINLPYDKRKASAEDKKAILENVHKTIGEQRFSRAKVLFDFVLPKFFPAYSDYVVADEKIYVFLYHLPEKPQEVLILNLHGKLINRSTVPWGQGTSADELPYCIYKGDVYFMIFNEETYKWELHSKKVG
jgi:hypothetical protein